MVAAGILMCAGVGYVLMSGKLEDMQQSQDPPVFFAPPTSTGAVGENKPYIPPTQEANK